jgi:hypothetical protein
MQWAFDFKNFSRHKKMVQNLLKDFESEIDAFYQFENLPYTLDSSTLLWNILHRVKFRETCKDRLFMRHEDVAAEPVEQFKIIYRYLNLPFTPRAEPKILAFSGDHNKAEPYNWMFSISDETTARALKIGNSALQTKRLNASMIKPLHSLENRGHGPMIPVHNLKNRLPGLKSRLPVPESRLPGLKNRLPGLKSRLPVPESRLPGLKTRLPAPGSRLPGLKNRLHGPESRLHGLENAAGDFRAYPEAAA